MAAQVLPTESYMQLYKYLTAARCLHTVETLESAVADRPKAYQRYLPVYSKQISPTTAICLAAVFSCRQLFVVQAAYMGA